MFTGTRLTFCFIGLVPGIRLISWTQLKASPTWEFSLARSWGNIDFIIPSTFGKSLSRFLMRSYSLVSWFLTETKYTASSCICFSDKNFPLNSSSSISSAIELTIFFMYLVRFGARNRFYCFLQLGVVLYYLNQNRGLFFRHCLTFQSRSLTKFLAGKHF